VISVSFLPYAIPAFGWCNNIIHTSLLKYRAFQQNPDKSFLVVVALDLLSKLTNCLGMELQPPINTSSPNLLAPLTGASTPIGVCTGRGYGIGLLCAAAPAYTGEWPN
jgi:hypothetical protein